MIGFVKTKHFEIFKLFWGYENFQTLQKNFVFIAYTQIGSLVKYFHGQKIFDPGKIQATTELALGNNMKSE